jgi:hypothetical protein
MRENIVNPYWHTFPSGAASAKGRTIGRLCTDAVTWTALTRPAVRLVACRATSPGSTGRWVAARLRTLTLASLPRRLLARLAARTGVFRTFAAVWCNRWFYAVLARAPARTWTVRRWFVFCDSVLAHTTTVTWPVFLHLSLFTICACARTLYLGSPFLERTIRAILAFAFAVFRLSKEIFVLVKN